MLNLNPFANIIGIKAAQDYMKSKSAPPPAPGPYLLTVGQDFIGVFEAALAALRIRLPPASLEIHVEHLTAAEHGDLWFGQLRIWSIYLGHGESLQHGQDGGKRDTKRQVHKAEPSRREQIICEYAN